ncbi:PAP2 superfamily protein [Lachnospiraceae bacterium RM5]|nr:PAP2 superfamily protein [Lachnospiraceae bacterium RM5]
MGNVFYFEWEVNLIVFLQRLLLDTGKLGNAGKYIVSLFTLFGEEMFLIVILGFIYWCYNKELGKSIGYSMLIGMVSNAMIKNIFLRRRPYFDNKEIKCLKKVNESAGLYDIKAQGFSFPSGHSTNSFVAYISLFYYNKKLDKKRNGTGFVIWKIIFLMLPILVGISRFILGVHYPTDVFFGWLMGLFTILVSNYFYNKIKNKWKLFLITYIISLSGFFYCKTADYFTTVGVMGGFFLAVLFEEKYVNFENTKKIHGIIFRIFFGLLLYFILSYVLKMPFDKEFFKSESMLCFFIRSLRYMIVSFVVLGVYPLLFNKLPIFGGKK